MRIQVHHGDLLEFPADVVLVKYADGFHGADLAVFQRLYAGDPGKGVPPSADPEERPPNNGEYRLYRATGLLAAHEVAVLGVGPLRDFDYRAIRDFGRRGLSIISGERPGLRVLAGPIHGPGYGLDELESTKALVAGMVDAISAGEVPRSLERIVLIEREHGRAARIREAVEALVPNGAMVGDRQFLEESVNETQRMRLQTAGYGSDSKKLMFVAMEFDDESEDLFNYGIRQALDEDVFLCERGDSDLRPGDILESVLNKIRGADYFIADVSTDNPNVLLELGYALGANRPIIIVARESRRDSLPFNIRNHRTIFYKNFTQLQDQLRKAVSQLAQP